MLIDGQGVIIFWGDKGAINKLYDALYAVVYRNNWDVFSEPLDIIRVNKPKRIYDIFLPRLSDYEEPINPKLDLTARYLVREDRAVQYEVVGELKIHDVESVKLSLHGQFPGKTELMAFCARRAAMFGENINFKIMYFHNSADSECLEAVYVDGQLVKNEYMHPWDAAYYIAQDSGLSVFSPEMWGYLEAWLEPLVDQIISERENKEDED
jgi:hypothetical protein